MTGHHHATHSLLPAVSVLWPSQALLSALSSNKNLDKSQPLPVAPQGGTKRRHHFPLTWPNPTCISGSLALAWPLRLHPDFPDQHFLPSVQIVAAILAIAGIVMMTYADGFHSHSVIGIALVVASASMSALYKVCAGSEPSQLAGLSSASTAGFRWLVLYFSRASDDTCASGQAALDSWSQLCNRQTETSVKGKGEVCHCSWLWLSGPFYL